MPVELSNPQKAEPHTYTRIGNQPYSKEGPGRDVGGTGAKAEAHTDGEGLRILISAVDAMCPAM